MTTKYQKDSLNTEGKTKRLFDVVDRPDLVIVQNKSATTADNDPSKTRDISGKDVFATTMTCRVFELLQKASIPVAYKEQISPTEFVTELCKTIPLESIARRTIPEGSSYLKRRPDTPAPHRFHRLVTELFLKTTAGGLTINDETLIDGLSPEQDDPFIADPSASTWQLMHSKIPSWDDSALISTIQRSKIITETGLLDRIDELTRKTFLLLEGMWNVFGYRLADFKIEFGMTTGGDLVIIDVIDQDSWRVATQDWTDMSKQSFRDGEGNSVVAGKYEITASIAQHFRIPKQALVLWRGSYSDELPDIIYEGFDTIEIVMSGHKATHEALARLEEIQLDYPDGGVIIPIVGRSNGLGPVIAAHTTWPVISSPAGVSKSPHDVWSSVSMPSGTPNAVAWPDKNAVQVAMNILAAKNPRVYMHRQFEMEKLDPQY